MPDAPEGRRFPRPDLSLIMPCYNEEESLPFVIPRLQDAFEDAGYRLELVAVDNGSGDRTGEIIAEMSARDPRVVGRTVETNIGFGNGILTGIPAATGEWVGMVAADGQVDAEDVVRLFEAARATDGNVIAKVRRRFRMDGFIRKVVSIGYNAFMLLLWPGLGSLDVNGNPRLMKREVLLALQLQSTDWMLDPEMLIKAHYMGVRVLELNVFARMRGGGLSNVRASTCWQFFHGLLEFRFTGKLREWREGVERQGISIKQAPPPSLSAD